MAWFLSGSGAIAGPIAAQTVTGYDERLIWSQERAYWQYVEDNNLTAYRALWHEAFLGWPSVSVAPVRKDHITDWITSQTAKGLRFKTVQFKPAAIQITGDVASAFYWITFQWVDKTGKGPSVTLRVMHTWIKDGSNWHIIDGMSMPKPASSASR
jgi:hypothetical protein